MTSYEDLFKMIDSIFTHDQIDPIHLRNFLELLLNQAVPKENSENVNTPTSLLPAADQREEEEEVDKLTDLIAKCETRLEKLMDTPKTKVLIRNEGHKLESIMEAINNLKNTNLDLMAQVAENTKALAKLKKLDGARASPFQDVINRFQKDSIYSDVCDLKKKLYEVENNLQELVISSNSLKEQVEVMHQKMINPSRITEIDEKVHKLLDWRALLREDLEALTERYEHIKTIKISKCQIDGLLESKVNYNQLSRYVSQRNFNLAKEDFIKEFQELKELCCQLQIHFTSKLVDLHRDVQKLFSALASKRRIEKRSLT